MEEFNLNAVSETGRWAFFRKRRGVDFLKKTGARELLNMAREVGLAGTLAVMKRHFRYEMWVFLGTRWDKKYDVNTTGHIDLINLTVVGANKEKGHAVVSTPPRIYRFLTQFFPASWPDFTFVDVGCGKGRVLLLALLQGFRNVIGIEIAPLICKIAEQNLSQFRSRMSPLGTCCVINADATQIDLPLGAPLLVYCANPFNVEMWKSFVPNLIKANQTNKMPMCLVLTGSVPEAIAATVEVIKESKGFKERAHGVSPFFLDAYLPYHYWVFDAD